VTSTASVVIAVTDLPTSSGPRTPLTGMLCGPRRTDTNRSLEPDVRGDHHAAVDDQRQGAVATGPVEVAGERSCRQVGVGPFPGPPPRKVVDRSGVMRLIERQRTGGLQ
jgi:hypothetical protein